MSKFYKSRLCIPTLLCSTLLVVSVAACSNSPFKGLSTFGTNGFAETADNAVEWTESLASANQTARSTGKMVLANFTGTDWCRYCIKLEEEVFATPEFAAWARENVVMLKVDYPQRLKQSDEVKEQNAGLKERYTIEQFPTVFLLDPDGNILAQAGYREGGPKAWIEAIETQLR